MARAPDTRPAPGPLHAAWYVLVDATDVGQMLLVSLLTGGAAMAIACAVANLALWLFRTTRGALSRRPTEGKRQGTRVQADGMMAG